MTMPKFDTICYLRQTSSEKNPPHGWAVHFSSGEVSLHTADQLTEAFEAGKRDAIPQWQPIETAPKDVFLLLYCPRIGIVRGHWNADKHSKKPSPYWTHDRERLYGIRETRYDQPTHWMPLPAAPKGEE